MASENLDIDSKTTEELYEWYLSDKLIINRRYQRKLVWSLEEKTALISSILQQYPIPLLLFVSIENKREILDGMQRLEALMSFIEQRYSLNGEFFNLDAIALTKDLKDSGKLRQQEPVLSREKSALIARYRFAISEYSSSEDHIDEVFRRINSNGKILSKQELRSAGCISNFSELVRKLSTIIRGDTTHNDVMGLNKIFKISISNEGLNYGISIENHFYIKHHVLSRRSIRDSDDEELVANILGYIILDDKPTSGSTSLDTFYGEGTSSHAMGQRALLETYIQTHGAEKIIDDYSLVYETIQRLFDEHGLNFRSHILGDDSTSQECPRYYQAVFLSLYQLLINESMDLDNSSGYINELGDMVRRTMVQTEGGRWAASARQRCVENLSALIRKYFKESERRYVNHAWQMLIKTLLNNSRTEQPSYDFKQGLFNLSGNNQLDEGCLINIVQTCVAINNIGKSSKGYVLVGIADTKSTADRVKDLYGICPIEYNGFFINGLDHEAILHSGNIDNYFLFIKQRIESYDFTPGLKQQILKDISLCSYNGLHILKIEVKSIGQVCHFENEFYIRQGSATQQVSSGDEIASLHQLYYS
ncbi:GmrSD restriction endonuclease domain-containing protein [Pantoea agglomerans]|uniref:GmrSD restriction endonuclease domain-containing protein n=1 Tax=Enterobacter agglomerans TaxID=549 RepID=UPI003BF59661